MAAQPRRLKAKVCLVGEHGVGKTSLIRRYVLDEFDDRYLVTLGAKVSKREMAFRSPEQGDIHLDMTIWDIMGSKGFRELLREAYFHGARGILAACDLTRYETLTDLGDWVETVFNTVRPVPIVLAVNKADLDARAAFDEPQVQSVASAFRAPYFFTSARTGENVEPAFRALAQAISEQAFD